MSAVATVKIALKGDREVVMPREFDAPRADVFRALTEPAIIRQWLLGPPWTMRVCDVDVRDGPHFPGGALVTTVLTEQLYAITIESPSQEARDGAMSSGMETGMEASFQRLDRILAKGR